MPNGDDHDLLIKINANVLNLQHDITAIKSDVSSLKTTSATFGERFRGVNSKINWLWLVVVAIITAGGGIAVAVITAGK